MRGREQLDVHNHLQRVSPLNKQHASLRSPCIFMHTRKLLYWLCIDLPAHTHTNTHTHLYKCSPSITHTRARTETHQGESFIFQPCRQAASGQSFPPDKGHRPRGGGSSPSLVLRSVSFCASGGEAQRPREERGRLRWSADWGRTGISTESIDRYTYDLLSS